MKFLKDARFIKRGVILFFLYLLFSGFAVTYTVAQVCVAPPANLVSWYRAEGDATDFVDGNNGILLGGATFGSGMVGTAFQLNGSGAFVDLGNAPNLQVSASDFTVDAWVNLASLPPGYDQSIVDKMQRVSTQDNEDGWRLLKQSDNHFWFCFGTGAGTNGCSVGFPTTVRSTTVVTTGVWYHVAAVKSSSAISLYVNGILEDTKPTPVFVDSNTTNLVIGSIRSSTIGPDAYFHGLIDEVEIANRALSSSEIAGIYAAGSAGKCTTSAYNFSGFFQPVDNQPTLNTVKAGSAIPVKFSLNGNQGLNIFAAGYPASMQVSCGVSASDAIEQTVTAGSSTLSYDVSTDQYTYVWKTAKAWVGTCRTLVVKLNDGSQHYADFQFK